MFHRLVAVAAILAVIAVLVIVGAFPSYAQSAQDAVAAVCSSGGQAALVALLGFFGFSVVVDFLKQRLAQAPPSVQALVHLAAGNWRQVLVALKLLSAMLVLVVLAGCNASSSVTPPAAASATPTAAPSVVSQIDTALATAAPDVQVAWYAVKAADGVFQIYAATHKLDPSIIANEQKAIAAVQALIANPATTTGDLVSRLTATAAAIMGVTPGVAAAPQLGPAPGAAPAPAPAPAPAASPSASGS